MQGSDHEYGQWIQTPVHPVESKNQWDYSARPLPADQPPAFTPQWPTPSPAAIPTAQSPRQHILKYWKWEIFQLLLAAGLLVAIVVILLHFENRQVPQWPLSINLTTIVSLLSTVLRAVTTASAAEILAQVKWTRFNRPRSLLELQRYDQASRGVVGAVGLVFGAPGSATGVLAGLIIILSLAVGPFTQQSIRNDACQIVSPDMNASVPAANYIVGDWVRVGAGLYEPNVGVQGALVNGVALPTGNDSAITASCPTGNCNWPTYDGVSYSTLGLCSACQDASLDLGSPGSTRNYSLPSGAFIDTNTVLAIAPDDLEWISSFSPQILEVLSASIVNITVLAYTMNPCNESYGFEDCSDNSGVTAGFDYVNVRPLAVSCAVYPCVRSFATWVAAGQLHETLVNTTAMFRSKTADEAVIDEDYVTAQSPCLIDGKLYDTGNFSLLPSNHSAYSFPDADGVNITAPYECIYQMDGTFATTVGQWSTDTLFNGSCASTVDMDGIYCVGSHSAFWLQPFFNDGRANLSTVSAVMDGFSTAATTKLREIGFSKYTDADGNNLPGLAPGVVYSSTVCTRFDWYWLLLPGGLIAVTALLLVATIVSNYANRRQPVWKSSLLPLLFHGFVEPAPSWRPLDRSELDQAAKNTEVRFEATDGPVGFKSSSIGPGEPQQVRPRAVYYDQAAS